MDADTREYPQKTLNRLKKDIKRRESELRERCKELECLYGISRIADREQALDVTLARIIDLIPSSWQYPDITCARLVIGEKEYRTKKFKKTKFRQFSEIRNGRNKLGLLEIYYVKKMPEADEGPFLLAERKLLNVIAERIGKIIERSQTEERLRDSNRQLQELFEHFHNVRENERKQIAYELHDELGHALTSLKLDLRWIKKNLQSDKDAILDKVVYMENEIDKTVNSIRGIVLELRPALLDDFGLIEALIYYAEEFQKRSGIECTIRSSVRSVEIQKNNSVGIFRIFQELLTNIVKHANARKVHVKISEIDKYLKIDIKDDGRGIRVDDLKNTKSFGIQGIRERLDIWGGKFSIIGKEGEGTQITICFPVKKEEKDHD